jgi:hypothetical protein
LNRDTRIRNPLLYPFELREQPQNDPFLLAGTIPNATADSKIERQRQIAFKPMTQNPSLKEKNYEK